ncbi:MAG: hypothetical protein VYC39_05050 [Myxococcota bacterium]|nr:hypothetical protein [Myxococcota bacterium]
MKQCYDRDGMFPTDIARLWFFHSIRRSFVGRARREVQSSYAWRLFLPALLMSCTPLKETVFIDVAQINSDIVFVFVSEADNSNVKLLSDTPRVVAELGNTPLLKLETETPHDKVLLLGLKKDQITALEPLTDFNKLSLSQLNPSSFDELPERDISVKTLPANASLQQIDKTGGKLTDSDILARESILSRYEIHLPIDLDRCRNDRRERLEVFFDPPDNCRKDYLDILSFDSQRFVAISSKHAQIFDKDEQPSCESASTTSTSSVQKIIRLHSSKTHAAVGTKQANDGSRLFVSVSEINEGELTVTSEIIERRLYPDGFSPIVSKQRFSRTNAGFQNFTGEAEQVTIDEQDHVFILYESGLIAEKPSRNESYHLTETTELSNNVDDRGKKHFQLTRNDAVPHLMTRTNFIHYGTLGKDSWNSFALDRLGSDIRPWDTAVGRDGNIYFAANDNGQGWIFTHRFEKKLLEEIRIRYPLRIGSCFVNGRLKRIRRIRSTRDSIYALASCNMLIRIRKKDLCQSFFHLEEGDSFEFSQDDLRGLTILEEELYTTNRDGRIHRVDLQNFDAELESKRGN